MSIPKVEVYWVDDWAALYKDGQLVYQGHSIRDEDYLGIMRSHGIATHEEYCDDIDGHYDEFGRFPNTVRELEQIRADFRLREPTRS